MKQGISCSGVRFGRILRGLERKDRMLARCTESHGCTAQHMPADKCRFSAIPCHQGQLASIGPLADPVCLIAYFRSCRAFSYAFNMDNLKHSDLIASAFGFWEGDGDCFTA